MHKEGCAADFIIPGILKTFLRLNRDKGTLCVILKMVQDINEDSSQKYDQEEGWDRNSYLDPTWERQQAKVT